MGRLRRGTEPKQIRLLDDRFLLARSAGTLNGKAAEPGPGGNRTVADTEGKLSISGGKLVCGGGKATPAWGDPGIWWSSHDRKVGRATLLKAKVVSGGNVAFGLDVNQAGSIDHHVMVLNGTSGVLSVYDLGAGSQMATLAVGTIYDLLIVERSAGVHYLIRGGAFTAWTLLWVSNVVNSSPLFPGMSNNNAAAELAAVRVVDLPAPWNTDYGIATSRLTNPAAGATATHKPDTHVDIEFTFDGTQLKVRYRKQDSNNFWHVAVAADGSLSVWECVDTQFTQRIGTPAGTVTNGAHRIIVKAQNNQHSVYLDNVQKGSTYVDPSNLFPTAIQGEVVNASGGISSLTFWPVSPPVPAGV